MIFLLMLDESCDENKIKKTCQLETVIDKCINDGR